MAPFNLTNISEAASKAGFGDSLDLGIDASKWLNRSRGTESQSNATKEAIKNSYQYPIQAIGNNQDYLLVRVFERRPPISSFTAFDLPRRLDNFVDTNGNPIPNTWSAAQAMSQMDDRFRDKGILGQKNDTGMTVDEILKKDMKYIYLPIPQTVSDSLAVDYAQDTLNPLQSLGMELAQQLIEDPGKAINTGAEALAMLKAGGLAQIANGKTEKLISSALSGVAINQLGANVNPMSLITRASGQILQSNLELLFSGVALRSFPFTFDFLPRSKTEADEVKGIIRVLKRAVVPKNGRQAVFINSPSHFHFQYYSGMKKHPFLNQFKVGVLSELTVNYNGAGPYSTYWDGTPTHIQVTCMYKEVSPIYQEDYDAIPPEEGVGY